MSRRPRREADTTGGFDPASFVSAAALVNEPQEEVDWIVDGLLPARGLSLLIARPKVGKSTLVRYLAHAVVRGGICLGRQTTRGGVLYISVEERRSDVRDHFARLGKTGTRRLQIHVGRMIGMPSDLRSPFAGDPDSIREHRLAWLNAAITHFRPTLVVVDPLFRFVAVKDGNDYAEVTAATDSVIALARERSVHLLLTHHTKKEDASIIDAALGSTALAGMVDTILLVRRARDNIRTLESSQRTGNDLEETILTYDQQTGQLSLGGTREEARQALLLGRILTYLATVLSATKKEILSVVHGDTGRKKAALQDAFNRGLVRRRGAGTPGRPYRYSLKTRVKKKEEEKSPDPTQPPQTSQTLGSASEEVICGLPVPSGQTTATRPPIRARMARRRRPSTRIFPPRSP